MERGALVIRGSCREALTSAITLPIVASRQASATRGRTGIWNMTTRFGLSGATLGVVAGVSVGLAGLIGWQYLRPVPAPVPPLAQIPGLLAAPVLPLMGQPPAATPGLTADGPPLPSLGPAPASGVAAPGADSPTEADHSLAAVPEVPDPILRDAAVRDAATGKAVTPAPAGPALQGQTADTLPEIPRFDTFRLGQDGTAVLAGIAAGAEEVVVLVDAVEVARTRPTANGRFAALFTLDPASTPRMLSLRALGLAGGEVASTESILLPPRIGDIAAVVGAVPRAGSDATTSAALGEMVRVREAPPPLAAADLPGGADPAGGTGRVLSLIHI